VCLSLFGRILRRFHSDASIAPSATAEQSAHNNINSGNSGEALMAVSSSANDKARPRVDTLTFAELAIDPTRCATFD
jgi:hypothetical protein